MGFKTTAEIRIPSDPLEQVIGQPEAVRIAKMAASQRRHLLLVAPPGTGKSMLAQAIAFHLPKPTEEVSVLHNPEAPERPLVEVRTLAEIHKEAKLLEQASGKMAQPQDVPAFVAERLGFRCRRCGRLSKASERSCPGCNFDKRGDLVFGNILTEYLPADRHRLNRVHTTRLLEDGREEVVIYERHGEAVRVLDQKTLENLNALQNKKLRKVIVPLARKNFIVAAGASEVEFFGDVKHDPYGGHVGQGTPSLGTPPYLRVVPGAAHEAHQGVLFIDELSALQYIQRYLFTAMQERKYSIIGRNPQSAGASVRVDDVPCDFVLIAASNINDLPQILPPLRSRIIGNGYEVLLDTFMPDNPESRRQLAQFIAQEIRKDGKIPHADAGAVEELTSLAAKRAREWDGASDALTLKLRELSGIIRLAGDLAHSNGAKPITADDVKAATRRGRNIEEQLQEKYGSVWKAGASELARERKTQQKEVG